MTTNIYLQFNGQCREAFAFYADTFRTTIAMGITYGEAPGGSPVPEESKHMVMHPALELGAATLMGCDYPGGPAMGGFRISLDMADEAEVRRLYAALSENGSVQMPLAPTFWSPLFGMVTDRFGVGWMVAVTGPQA